MKLLFIRHLIINTYLAEVTINFCLTAPVQCPTMRVPALVLFSPYECVMAMPFIFEVIFTGQFNNILQIYNFTKNIYSWFRQQNKLDYIMKLIFALLLIAIAYGMETRIYDSQNQGEAIVGQIGRLTILDDQLFFVGKDHRHFGFISKSDGKATRISKLGQNERIIDETKRKQLYLVKNKFLFDYNVTTKHGQTDKRFVKSDIEEIKQYLRAPEGIYVLTDKDLRLYEDGKGKNLTSFKVLIDKSKLEKGKKQQYLEIIKLSDEKQDVLILFSLKQDTKTKERQLCLNSFFKNTQKQQKCYAITEEGVPSCQRSGNTAYIVFSAATYAINEKLQIVTKIKEKVVQFHQGAAIIDGHKSYLPHKDAIYDKRAVQSNGLEQIYMQIQKEEIQIIESDKVIGKVQKNEKSQPYRSWIRKYEKENKYELVIQAQNLVLSLYTLVVNKKGEYVKTTMNWQRETRK